MQKNGLRNIILCVLTVLFLATGVWILTQRIQKQNAYLEAAAQAEHTAQNLDTSALEAREAEEQKILAENSEMEAQVSALQEELASLDQDLAQLQQEYDQLAQEEDSVYYQTIFQSLMEGVSLVESYINGNE